ncbi:MAG: hypothetical protein QGD90_00930, partial [Candidatus Hydrogenedentes bacterium]|nr:hypothetical protein [Candidatus Hydrogenedentota bacterium]
MPLAISPVTLAIQAQKSPSSKLRNPPPWLHPRQIERSYAVMLQRLTKEFTRQVRDIVIPALASISEQADTELGLAESARLDAWSDRVEELMSILRIGATKREKSVDALAVDIGQRTSNWNNKEWQKILRRTVGVSLLQSEPGLRERLRLFVETNTKLIGNMQTQGIEKINGIIERGFSTGARHTTVAADIETALGVEENKARLTARDQVSKLNGRLTQMRQVEAGIPHYIWQTAEDIRVRTS